MLLRLVDDRSPVMVGDAATDAGSARAAGTPLILVDFGYTEIPAAELAPENSPGSRRAFVAIILHAVSQATLRDAA